MTYKSLQDYCDELIARSDSYGQQLLDEFGNGDGIYEDELGMWHAPSDYSYASHQKIRWICKNNHQWYTAIKNRTLTRTKCPYCYGEKIIIGENDLASQFPEIAKEWDYEYNGDLKPENIRMKSGKKVGWICEKKHRWQATVANRTVKNSDCPYCSANSTSYPEQFIYWGLKALYPNTENRVKLFKSEDRTRGFEYDIYVPDLKLLIEYSSDYWHEGKEERDQLKKELAKTNGYQIIEIIENDKKSDIETYKQSIIKVNNKTLEVNKVLDFILNQFNHSINELDLKEIESFAYEYSKGKIEYEKSLEYLRPDLAKEWDYESNTIKPSEITQCSGYNANWICEKRHHWKAKVSNRFTSNSGCPICYQNKIKARSRINYLPTF